MTEVHTCSYSCQRIECIRAQRDELVARLAAAMSQQQGGGERECSHEAWEENGGWCTCVDCGHGWSARTTPPSAPVGVEELVKLLERIRDLLASLPVDCLGSGTGASGQPYPIRDEVIHGITKALAQQPAAVDGMAELVGLLDEVRSHFTRDDDLPDDLLPRIDAALATKHQEPTT